MLYGLPEASEDAEIDKLTCLAYDELRRLAHHFLHAERENHTLQPTALVHEAYLKLAAQKAVNWQNKGQLLAIAAGCMRNILVDHARNRIRLKRGGHYQFVPIEEVTVFSNQHSFELLDIDAALNRLSDMDPRQGMIVELRFYGGLSIEETAEVLNMSPKTVKRNWSSAKAWLYGELKEQHEAEGRAVGTD
jgi:RNA polymerase sigma factor (TIGR02999 family)